MFRINAKMKKLGGSGIYASISSLRDSKDSGVINRILKSGRGVDKGKQKAENKFGL